MFCIILSCFFTSNFTILNRFVTKFSIEDTYTHRYIQFIENINFIGCISIFAIAVWLSDQIQEAPYAEMSVFIIYYFILLSTISGSSRIVYYSTDDFAFL
jgi:hypothetical protein